MCTDDQNLFLSIQFVTLVCIVSVSSRVSCSVCSFHALQYVILYLSAVFVVLFDIQMNNCFGAVPGNVIL